MTRTTCSSSTPAPRRPLPRARLRVSTARGSHLLRLQGPSGGPQASGPLGPELLLVSNPTNPHPHPNLCELTHIPQPYPHTPDRRSQPRPLQPHMPSHTCVYTRRDLQAHRGVACLLEWRGQVSPPLCASVCPSGQPGSQVTLILPLHPQGQVGASRPCWVLLPLPCPPRGLVSVFLPLLIELRRPFFRKPFQFPRHWARFAPDPSLPTLSRLERWLPFSP